MESIKRTQFSIPESMKSCVATPPYIEPQPPRSCADVQLNLPGSSSGIYTITTDDNTTVDVYCNMETLCGIDGGWTRIAYLNMTDTTESCPNGWRLYEVDNIRACGRLIS